MKKGRKRLSESLVSRKSEHRQAKRDLILLRQKMAKLDREQSRLINSAGPKNEAAADELCKRIAQVQGQMANQGVIR